MKNNTFVNYVTSTAIHDRTATGKDGKAHAFKNVSLPLKKSLSGFASIAVNPGQIIASTKKDGTVVDGRVNVMLGKPDATRKVSIAIAKREDDSYEYSTVEMTNEALATAVNEARNEYKTSKATVQA